MLSAVLTIVNPSVRPSQSFEWGVGIAEWLTSRTDKREARVRFPVGAKKFSDGICIYL